MDDYMEFLTDLPQKNKGKRDRGYYYNQRQRIIKKRMCIARRKGINVYHGKLAKSSVPFSGKQCAAFKSGFSLKREIAIAAAAAEDR